MLTSAASALGLGQSPLLCLQQNNQPFIHYLELPSCTQLPGLSASQQATASSSTTAAAALHRGNSEAVVSSVGQPVLVISSRLVEVLQPEELQMMFLGALSTALAPGRCAWWFTGMYSTAQLDCSAAQLTGEMASWCCIQMCCVAQYMCSAAMVC